MCGSLLANGVSSFSLLSTSLTVSLSSCDEAPGYLVMIWALRFCGCLAVSVWQTRRGKKDRVKERDRGGQGESLKAKENLLAAFGCCTWSGCSDSGDSKDAL